MNAHKESVPEGTSEGCFFHLSTAVHRRVDSLGFRNRYMQSTAFRHRVGAVVHLLAYLPLDFVERAFGNLKFDLSQHEQFIPEHFEHTYIGTNKASCTHPNEIRSATLFSPSLWSAFGAICWDSRQHPQSLHNAAKGTDGNWERVNMTSHTHDVDPNFLIRMRASSSVREAANTLAEVVQNIVAETVGSVHLEHHVALGERNLRRTVYSVKKRTRTANDEDEEDSLPFKFCLPRTMLGSCDPRRWHLSDCPKFGEAAVFVACDSAGVLPSSSLLLAPGKTKVLHHEVLRIVQEIAPSVTQKSLDLLLKHAR